MLKSKDWLKLKAQDSSFYILVIQDHIESIGKANTIKEGWGVDNEPLAQVLNDMLQNPQLLSHFHIWPKPKAKLGPTDSFYPAPPSFTCHKPLPNPNQFGLTDGISVSPRWACKLSVTCCNIFGPTEICNRSHRVCLANSLFRSLPKSVPPSLSNRSNRVLDFP